jgi:ATP-binding cassette, subfamily C (CFTR/MRP), member 1
LDFEEGVSAEDRQIKKFKSRAVHDIENI